MSLLDVAGLPVARRVGTLVNHLTAASENEQKLAAFAKQQQKLAGQDNFVHDLHLKEQYKKFLVDPYAETPTPRDAVTDSVEVIIVGAGFASLLTAVRLKQAGVTVRIIEKGGDVGGTWLVSQHVSQCIHTDLPLNALACVKKGTGTVTLAAHVMSNRTRTCRCWKRWTTSPVASTLTGHSLQQATRPGRKPLCPP
jgi:hypothetical protein